MAFQAPPVRDEREGYAAYLAQQQDAFRALAHGLTDAEATAAPSASAISIAWLIKHATVVQRNWLAGVLAAPYPIAPGDVTAITARSDAIEAQDTLASLLAAYDEVCREVLAAVQATDPDTPMPVPDAPWFPKDVGYWSVRWVWLHLVEELARHAGHGDIVRETLDGATMYPLVAAHDGAEPSPWLQPWQRTAPPVTTGVSTVTLSAADVPAARDWYSAALDAPVDFENPFYAEFTLGPHRHEFGIVSDRFTDGPVVYLWVPDIDTAITRFTKRGARVEHEPRDFTGTGRYVGAVLRDPFGNRLGLMQRPHPGERR